METLLDINSIDSVNDIDIVKENIPEWGGYVFIKQISLKDRLSLESKYLDSSGKFDISNKDFIVDLVSYCLCDSDGKRIFVNDKDLEILRSKNAKIVMNLFIKCNEHNYGTKEAIESLEKK